MINFNQIKPDMLVVCSEDSQFAIVDHLEGTNYLKLKKDKAGQHHYIPLSWVGSIEGGKVKMKFPRQKLIQEWLTVPPSF